MTVPYRIGLGVFLAVSTLVIGGYFAWEPPMKQPLSYHDFADQRTMLGMPNMLNVMSNFPFLFVGVWGLIFMAGPRSRRAGAFLESAERWPYWIFFVGLALTAIGSGYYHNHPTNETLAWDRAPLAITFMALFTAVLAERLHWKLAIWLLGPLVLLGVGSVVYWHWTEMHGVGDMRLYLVVQFYPLLALPLLLICFRPRYTGSADLLAALLCYALAKGLELLDREIYSAGAIVSGHTLKHLVAGLSGLFVLSMLWRRRPLAA